MQNHLSVLFFFSLVLTSPMALRPIKPELGTSIINNSNTHLVKEDLVVASQAKNTVFAYVDTSARTFGAYGDGVHDDTKALQAYANWCFGGPSVPHSTNNAGLNHKFHLFNGVFNTSAPIYFKDVCGAILEGEGEFSTSIVNSKTPIFITNGFQYNVVQNMRLVSGNQNNILFDLDWDGHSGGCALQSNKFYNIYAQGGYAAFYIAKSGLMGSENSFYDCFCQSNKLGYICNGYNALSNHVYNGDIQGDSIGICSLRGVISATGTSMQAQSYCDIQTPTSANDCVVYQNIRTESQNFLMSGNALNVTLIGCYQTSSLPGIYASNITGTIIGGGSMAGVVYPNPVIGIGNLSVSRSYFGRLDWLQGVKKNMSITILGVQAGQVNNAGGQGLDSSSIFKNIIQGNLILNRYKIDSALKVKQ